MTSLQVRKQETSAGVIGTHLFSDGSRQMKQLYWIVTECHGTLTYIGDFTSRATVKFIYLLFYLFIAYEEQVPFAYFVAGSAV